MTTVRHGASQIGAAPTGTAQIRAAPIGPVQLARLLRLPEPTPEQAAVVAEHRLGPLAVIAGAGSGKSETMAARLVWLVANGMVRPDGYSGSPSPGRLRPSSPTRFAPGWNDCAARAWKNRRGGPNVASASNAEAEDPLGGDPVIGTYHAYAGRLVRDNALREGLEPSMR